MRSFKIVLVLFSLSATAVQAEFKVHFDCYLHEGPVSCAELEGAFFSSIPYLKKVSKPKQALVSIKVRGMALDRSYRYEYTMDGAEKLPKFSLTNENNVLKTVSPDGARAIVLSDLQNCMAPFLRAKEAAQTKDGITTLKLTDPTLAGAPSPGGSNSTGWYFAFGGNGTISNGTSFQVNGNANTELNYSDPDRWKFNVNASASYTNAKVSYIDPATNAEVQEVIETTAFAGRVLLARTIKDGWSVAAILSPAHSSGSNLDFDGKGEIGIEWTLVPFIKTSDSTVGVQYVIGVERQNYDKVNVLNKEAMTFFEHSMLVYLRWHSQSFIAEVSGGAGSIVDDLDFFQAGGDVSLTFPVTDALRLSVYGGGSYRKALINEPAVSNVGSGFEQFLSGGNYSQWTYGSGIGFSYTIGNSGLKSGDQRWKK